MSPQFNKANKHMDNRVRQMVIVSWVSIIANAFLAFLKISIGFWAGSLAVVGDGIDSTSDILTSFITLFTARIISRPPSLAYPYGYNRADTIATKVLAFVIFFAGAELLMATIANLYKTQTQTLPDKWAVYVTIFSVFAKLLLARYQLAAGQKLQSAMLKANAKNMQNDVIISGSVLVGLLLTYVFNMPALDSVMALLVSLWIIKVGFEIFMESNTELMDGVRDASLYERIFEAVSETKGACNPHRTRIRKMSNFYIIELDIEVEPTLTIAEAHSIGQAVELRIKQKIDNVYDILVHLEPLGNVEDEEKYGASSYQFYKL